MIRKQPAKATRTRWTGGKPRISSALERGLEFLADAQLESGEIAGFLWQPGGLVGDAEFDSSPFPTALALYSLAFVAHPLAPAIRRRGLAFLESEMEGRGLWRYWSSRNPKHRGVPPDLEDTCCASHVLEHHDRELPANQPLILRNRNAQGKFYTWVLPRLSSPFAFRRLLGTVRYLPFLWSRHPLWRSTEAAPDDLDAAVNASVLLYLGDRDETRAAADYLLEIFREERELAADKWYLDPCALYYMVSRPCFHGVRSLAPLRDLIPPRLARVREADGGYGGALNTALAACTKLNLGLAPTSCTNEVQLLLADQVTDGGWGRAPLYYGGPKRARCWGSRELTTALCLEALGRCVIIEER